MEINISQSDKDVLLRWAQETLTRAGHYGDDNTAFPEEESLVSLLKMHQGGSLDLSLNKLTVLLFWAEDVLDCNFGSGTVAHIQQGDLLKKVQRAYNLLCDINGIPSSKQLVRLEDEDTTYGKFHLEKKTGKTIWWVFGAVLTAVVLVLIVVGLLK